MDSTAPRVAAAGTHSWAGAGRAPDVFLIGVPRAGTTSLYYGLGQHPSIFASEQKEACFTCPDVDSGVRRTQTRWFESESEYRALFRPAAGDQLILEGCIYNVYSPQAPQRIRQLNADARFLVQLRDPIEQMYSNHALKWIMADVDERDFGAALAAQQRARVGRTSAPINFRDYDMRDKATVGPGLAGFIAEFGRERIHVSVFDDFAADGVRVAQSIFRFLGLDDAVQPRFKVMVPNRTARSDLLNRAMASSSVISTAKRLVPAALRPAARRAAEMGFRVNRRPVSRPPLERALRDQLREEFRPEVERLSELSGIDLVDRWWSD